MMGVLIWTLASAAWAEPIFQGFDPLAQTQGAIKVEADELTGTDQARQISLTGNVHLSTENLEGWADRMEIFIEERRAVMLGRVRVVQGAAVMQCDRMELNSETSEAVFSKATIYVKKNLSAAQLSSCAKESSALALAKAGLNVVELGGEKMLQHQSEYQVEKARLTTCDCGDEKPSWELRASGADILPAERAWLWWPVLYLKGLPVFILPAAYLPLSDRRTGLLFPQINFSGRDGLVLNESLFVTLGQSADTTLSLDWFQERGLRERVEFRAIPARGDNIEFAMAHIADHKPGRVKQRLSGESNGWIQTTPDIALQWEARLFSDSDINRDFVSDMSARATEEATSTVLLSQRKKNVWWAVDAIYRQDLRGSGVDLFGSQDRDINHPSLDLLPQNTIGRLGAFSFSWLPAFSSRNDVSLGLNLEAANLSSLGTSWQDFGMVGIAQGLGSEADGRLSNGDLRRAVRFLIEPELLFPFRAGSVLDLEIRLAHRQLAYVPHGTDAPRPSSRGISFADVRLGTELSRSFGVGPASLGHVISPWLRMAGAWPGLASSDPWPYFDARDRMMKQVAQGLAGFDTGLFLQDPQGDWTEFLHLMLCQALDLTEGKWAQMGGELEATLAYVTGRVWASWEWQKQALAEVDLSLRFSDRRGDALSLAYVFSPSQPNAAQIPLPLSERAHREDGLLFGILPETYHAIGDTVHVVQASSSIYLGSGLSLSGGFNLDLYAKKLNWYGGGIGYRSDCNCWGFSLNARMLRGQPHPDIFFLLDMGIIGSMGTGNTTRF